MIALTGPVRQVETVPTSAASIEPAPQATVIALIGGLCSAALSTAIPWPFCTTSTVIASGMTSSTIARHENSGAYRLGWASTCSDPPCEWNLPRRVIAAAPTKSAPISGGRRRDHPADALSARKATIIGAAIQKSSRTAYTKPRPKRRKTPATIPITIGIGTACIARRTQPDRPSASMSPPVARKAPMTSAQRRWLSAAPTSTVPGIVQKKTSGCR